MMKKGFSMIELIVVIVIMGILMTLAGPKIVDTMNKAKATDIVSQIKMINNAVAKTQSVTGNFYQSTGGNALGVASPQPLTTLTPGKTCGENPDNPPANSTIEYLGDSGPVKDLTCYGLRTEEQMYLNLIKAKFFYSTNDNTFRLNKARLAHVEFPFEVNGVRVVRISGISGIMAYNIMKILNGSSQLSDQDGLIASKPVSIVKYNLNSQTKGKVDVGIEKPCLQSLDSLTTNELSYNCLVSGQTGLTQRKGSVIYTRGDEELVKKAPKVTLYYTLSLGE